MNLKKLSLAAVITVSVLAINGAVNAAQISQNTNLLCDMGQTGYAAPCKPHKHHKCPHKKAPKKAVETGAAAPVINRPAPQYAGPYPNLCPKPCKPCVPCRPCPTGGAACPAPCPAPCVPCNPCNQ
jgi:hypothetical protein